MITVQLNGGIGNQMFQYAAGKALSLKHKVPLSLDIGCCNTFRPYALYNFNSSLQLVENDWIAVKFKVIKGIVYTEHGFGYDKRFWDCGPNTYLQGYFQSEKYFKPIEQEIRKEFTRDAKPRTSEESVSVHIRRGDYVGNTVHNVLEDSYYNRAKDIIETLVKNPVYYYFSDDPNYATKFTPYEDMLAMSRCKHHIIANSSFSWWGAWLGDAAGNIVIAPKKWFVDETIPLTDLISQRWIQV